jgi:hypothetical protein
MDRFIVMLMVGLAVLSAFEPPWEANRPSAWLQVSAMAGGLFLIGLYACFR